MAIAAATTMREKMMHEKAGRKERKPQVFGKPCA